MERTKVEDLRLEGNRGEHSEGGRNRERGKTGENRGEDGGGFVGITAVCLKRSCCQTGGVDSDGG